MQEPCKELECSGASPTLDIVKKEPPSWTPEDFLQSTLHEGKGIVCPAGGGEPTKSSRGRRKQQWKLKFHHQALPPEYLDHYEASLNKSRPSMAHTSPQLHQQQSSVEAKLPPPTSLYDLNHLPNESIHSWLQRITSIQNEIQKNGSGGPPPTTSRRRRTPPASTSASSSAPKAMLNYRDLPYMGEMTLNNSKPRRGRKPKKADICHLIYKNYGTIFPGTPSHLVDERLMATTALPAPPTFAPSPIKQEPLLSDAPPSKQRTDLQNRIISSLLEKRLSQESKKNKETKARKPSSRSQQIVEVEPPPLLPSVDSTEPLNLCLKDLNNLKIRLLRKHGNVYAKAKTEPVELEEAEPDCDSSSSPTLKISEPDFKRLMQETPSDATNPADGLPGGYVYWPNAGVFVHPLALQSQLLSQLYQGLGNSYALPGEQAVTAPPEVESPTASSDSSVLSNQGRHKRAANTPTGQAPATKRKRSAIFIPPVANESSTSPATEVSICKFKFTGGARPSLQEKKMLSVDSGGNFRYYSGTGDKASRGYEFFPRESLQQHQAGSLMAPSTCALPSSSTPAIVAKNAPAANSENSGNQRRKRKSRKSLQREKLEQTFKEKGFLIQTQQLESAEGATYCKFRQLRKFTRYLFRSWKDYLPGAINGEAGGASSAMDAPATTPTSPTTTASTE